MTLADITLERVSHVTARMRQADKDEIYATRWDDDPERLAKTVVSFDPTGFVVLADDGEPVSVFGVYQMWPGVFSVFMFATDRWNEVSVGMTKFVMRDMIPSVMSGAFVRAECRSLSTHTQAHRWLEMLGAYKESEQLCFGKNGETFFTYVWTKQPTKTN
jgi:hypothetical protein